MFSAFDFSGATPGWLNKSHGVPVRKSGINFDRARFEAPFQDCCCACRTLQTTEKGIGEVMVEMKNEHEFQVM